MATTAIIPLHINKGKTAGKCIKERLDYIMNPGKTQGGTLVSSHACAPETAANEFMLLRNAYLANTGRTILGEIIGYHVRQSFKPGEITPELANNIGYELAARLTNGEHAYVVATHTDRRHIHNHIFICSYALDGNYKLLPLKVLRVECSTMNDLRIVLSNQVCIEIFADSDVEDEQWRFFMIVDEDFPALVAYSNRVEY